LVVLRTARSGQTAVAKLAAACLCQHVRQGMREPKILLFWQKFALSFPELAETWARSRCIAP